MLLHSISVGFYSSELIYSGSACREVLIQVCLQVFCFSLLREFVQGEELSACAKTQFAVRLCLAPWSAVAANSNARQSLTELLYAPERAHALFCYAAGMCLAANEARRPTVVW